MSDSFDVIPMPVRSKRRNGEYRLGARLLVRSAAELQPAARELAALLSRYGVTCVDARSEEQPDVRFELAPGSSRFGDEGYRLELARGGVRIEASADAGAYYAVQTIRQLLPPPGEPGGAVALPCGTIEDGPRFSWRGLQLDVSRHFFDVDVVMRMIDHMALLKMNRFHWHLTDDQGWRIEIDRFPLLTERSAWRCEPDGRRTGGFYTKEQIREVVAYAAARHITVVPEIEMPGHAQAALASYPELSCRSQPVEVWAQWGVSKEVLCAGNEATFSFLERVLDEVIELFPSAWIHVGGDECPKERWRECERCRSRMESEHLANEHELQSYFIRRIERSLNARGKRMIGWDEILEGGLAPNATVMSWRGTSGGIDAARSGHDVVMCPESHCYLDHKQSTNPVELGPTHFDPPVITLDRIYSFEPVPSGLGEHEARSILGVQANVWTEAIATRDRLDYMMFPRLSALAETAWSPASRKSWSSFKERLRSHAAHLAHLGIAYCHVIESL